MGKYKTRGKLNPGVSEVNNECHAKNQFEPRLRVQGSSLKPLALWRWFSSKNFQVSNRQGSIHIYMFLFTLETINGSLEYCTWLNRPFGPVHIWG